MKNKKVVLSVLAGIVIAGAIIAWLMLSGDKPITVNLVMVLQRRLMLP